MLIAFFVLAAVAIITAVSMLITRNTLYAAMFLVLNFTTVAIIYLILGAPFIATTQITVYAGSVVVLFLFVIMLLGAERLGGEDNLVWQRWIAIPLVLILVADLAYFIIRHQGLLGLVGEPPVGYGAPTDLGKVLFTTYALPVEITAVILLVAVVGAVLLARPDRERTIRRDQLRRERGGE